MKGKILHVSNRDGNLDVYFINQEGHGTSMTFPLDHFEGKTPDEIVAAVTANLTRFLDARAKRASLTKTVDLAAVTAKLTNMEIT